LDRLVGFLGMVVVATAAFVLGFRLINDTTMSLSILALTLLSFILTLVLFHEKIYSFCCRIFSAFPNVREKLMEMHYAIAMLKNRREVIYLTVAYACTAQVILAVTYFLLAKALHQDVALIYFLVFSPLICVFTSLPSIGGLGVREAGTAVLFAKAGMTAGVSVSMSLMVYLFTVIVGVAGAVFYATTHSPREEGLAEVKETLKTELLD